MNAAVRPRISLGTMCRGGGKIYVSLRCVGTAGLRLEASARVAGTAGARVPARMVRVGEDAFVLVLCVLDAAQVVRVVALDSQGTCVAQTRRRVGRRAAQLASKANSLIRPDDVEHLRGCDARPRPGEMALEHSYVVRGRTADQDRLHVRISYPVFGVAGQGEELEVEAFAQRGDALQADEVCLLGSALVPHASVEGVWVRHVCLSVPAAPSQGSLAVWVRSAGDRPHEGLWCFERFALDDLRSSAARNAEVHARPFAEPGKEAAARGKAALPRAAVVEVDAADGVGAINEKVAACDAEYVVLVPAGEGTPDQATVRKLVEVASREGVGLAAGCCLFADGTRARGGLLVDHLNWRIEDYLVLHDEDAPMHEVTAACGELLAFDRRTWDAVGGACEEAGERAWFADLSLKVRERGLRVVEVPGATARISMTARDLGVIGWNERMCDVAADAWLKQRWPEVLAVPDAFAGAQEVVGQRTDDAAEGVRVRVTKAIRDGDCDIVRGEVVARGAWEDLQDHELRLEVRVDVGDAAGAGETATDDSRAADPITSWVCMGDRSRACEDGRVLRTTSFSVRVPTRAKALSVRAELVGSALPAETLTVQTDELDRMREAWRNQTTPPDADPSYDSWFRTRHRATERDLALQREASELLVNPPLFSVVVDAANVDERDESLVRTRESVDAQTYAHHELLVGSVAEPSGAYVLRLEPGDVLEPDALFWLAREATRHPGARAVYADEDSLCEGSYVAPLLKPDFDAERLRCQKYLGRMVATRAGDTGGGAVRHVPRVLLHAAVPHAPERVGSPDRVTERERPLVSIVIPNKDMAPVLERCARSVLERTSYQSIEVIVVENNSEQQETFALYDSLVAADPRVRVVTCRLEGGFNFSRLINFGFEHAKGSYLLMLNNDTEVLDGAWLDHLVATCMRDEVGCVGAKLLYPDDTVQHAGVLVGSHLGPWHANMDVPADDEGYLGINVIPHGVRAVTGACLLTKREVWESVGGMDEGLPVDYNDVDLCLKIGAKGFAVVMRPDVTLRHYESVSRGGERSLAAAAGFVHAEGILRARWGDLIFGEDPSFNPNFRHNSGRYVLDR